VIAPSSSSLSSCASTSPLSKPSAAQFVVRVCGEGKGKVEAVVLIRGEVYLDRDATVFGVSLHDGQCPVHVGRATLFQILEGIVKQIISEHILSGDFVSNEGVLA
jgi:hypothetical protein